MTRFDIRGKIPFEVLKTLRAVAMVSVTPELRRGRVQSGNGEAAIRSLTPKCAPRSLASSRAGPSCLPLLLFTWTCSARVCRSVFSAPRGANANDSSLGTVHLGSLLALLSRFVPGQAHAQESDETVLGTIDVNGSAGAAVPLPKLAVEPLLTNGRVDEIAQLVMRGDLVLSGQFDVLDEGAAPSGPFLTDIPPNLDAWKKVGAEYVVRVYSRDASGADPRLVGEST